MELVLNLNNVDKSDISYKIFRFPDGEIQIELGDIDRKSTVVVHTRITNAEELFIVLQVADILNRQGVEWNLVITYLMSMRMDRVMSYNRPFTLKIVGKLLKDVCKNILVVTPHSDRTCNELEASSWSIFNPEDFCEHYTLVFPDKGAAERYDLHGYYNAVVCSKERDIETGAIKRIKVDNPEVVLESEKPFMVLDDLCDGGGTFAGVAAAIKEVKPSAELNISVTHMVNPKGIQTLSDNYNTVNITNSYKDWDNLPTNVKMINLN